MEDAQVQRLVGAVCTGVRILDARHEDLRIREGADQIGHERDRTADAHLHGLHLPGVGHGPLDLGDSPPARVDEDQGEWLIWGLEEDQFNEGRKEFQEFRAAPDHAKYQGAGAEAKRIREEERRRLAEIDRNYQDIRRQWQPTVGGAARRTPITVAMIGVCIVVAV